jgi:hypothetical protein
VCCDIMSCGLSGLTAIVCTEFVLQRGVTGGEKVRCGVDSTEYAY